MKFHYNLVSFLLHTLILHLASSPSVPEEEYPSTTFPIDSAKGRIGPWDRPVYIYINKENLDLFKGKYTLHDGKLLLFDIDGTLYKLMHDDDIEKESKEVVYNKLRNPNVSKPFSEVKEAGLEDIYKELRITPDGFKKAMRNLTYEDFIKKDEKLINFLSRTRLRLWCFTNAYGHRAKAVLEKLEVEHFFEGVICTDFHIEKPTRKPWPEAYEFVEQLLGVDKKEQICFFDDMEENVLAALERGWRATHVGPEDDLISLLEKIIV